MSKYLWITKKKTVKCKHSFCHKDTRVFSFSFLSQERNQAVIGTADFPVSRIFQYPISAPCHCNTVDLIPAHRKIKQVLKMILLMDQHLKICEIQSPHQSFTIIIFYIFYKRKWKSRLPNSIPIPPLFCLVQH